MLNLVRMHAIKLEMYLTSLSLEIIVFCMYSSFPQYLSCLWHHLSLSCTDLPIADHCQLESNTVLHRWNCRHQLSTLFLVEATRQPMWRTNWNGVWYFFHRSTNTSNAPVKFHKKLKNVCIYIILLRLFSCSLLNLK